MTGTQCHPPRCLKQYVRKSALMPVCWSAEMLRRSSLICSYSVISRSIPISEMIKVKMPDIRRARTAQISSDTQTRLPVSILFQVKEKMTPSHMAIQQRKNRIINVRFKTIMHAPYLSLCSNHICIFTSLQGQTLAFVTVYC